MVPQEMAPERPGWRSDHRPLRRRYRCRVPTQAGCGAVPPRRSGEAGPVRSQTPPGQDPPRGVRAVRGNEPSPARGGKPETFDFLGFTHYCTTTRRGRFRLGRKPVAKRVNRTLARIDEVLRKRWHHDIWEVGRWLGRVCEGWLNYFAVPGSGRFIRAFHRRLQRLWMRALRRRSQRDRFSWRRLERMT